MADAKDLEIEISTEGARSLLEIGFDLGIEATKAAIADRQLVFPFEVMNPFRASTTTIFEQRLLGTDGSRERRASTVVTQIERVEADAAANARAHAPVIRGPKSAEKACECEQGTHCGRRPAGHYMKDGWPDSLVLCDLCEADDHAH